MLGTLLVKGRLLGMAAVAVAALVPIRTDTYCHIRLRKGPTGLIEAQPCSSHSCTDPEEDVGLATCEGFGYSIGGHTYRRCDCPNPSYSLDDCYTLLVDDGLPTNDYSCHKSRCQTPCEKEPLDANYLPRCDCN